MIQTRPQSFFKLRALLAVGLAVAACCGLGGAATAQAIKLANPSFEEGTAGWHLWVANGSGTFTRDTGEHTHGRASGRVTVREGRSVLATTFAAEPDTVYRVAFTYRTQEAPSGPGASVSLRPSLKADTGQFLCFVGAPFLERTEGRWRQAEFYIRTHPNTATCAIELHMRNDQTIWFDAFNVRVATPAPGDHVYGFHPVVREPIYDELLGDEPMPYDVLPNWAYNLESSDFGRMALKFGYEHRRDAQYAEVAEHQLASEIRGPNRLAEKYEVPVLGFVHNYPEVIVKGRQELGIKTVPPLTDAVNRRLMLEYVNNMHKRWGDQLWGLFLVDEPYPHMSTLRNQWPEDRLAEVDAEVKSRYGGGRFGVPSSTKADEPFNWIAYRRWLEDRLFDLFQEIQRQAKANSPDVVLVGPDEISMGAPRDWERLAATWDISTGQSLPAWDRVQQHTTGYITKMMVDLTFKPTMPFAQVSAYDHATTPEFTQEQVSQVLRNGGVGYWINGVEWFDREFNHPKYNAPNRWEAMLALAEKTRQTPQLKFPEADSAILYSVDTFQADPARANMAREVAAAYTFLGPEIGSWFHFISEPQLERGSRDLSDYKVIYLPAGQYMRKAAVERLIDYVRGGGKLVCLDPGAFKQTDDGEDLTPLRRQLLGVVADGEISPTQLVARGTVPGLELPGGTYPLFGVSTKLVAEEGRDARSVMRFDDGSPGAVLHSLGQGATLTLAYNPARASSVDHENWRGFFRAIQRWAGAETDHSIWQFQLPLEMPQREDPTAGLVCLTNNHVQMVNAVITTPRNVDIGGGYRYQLAPAEEGGSEALIGFDTGKLTNRKAAYASTRDRPREALGKAEKPYVQADWAISWPAANEPLVIEIELDRARPVRLLRLLGTGHMPAMRVETSAAPAGADPDYREASAVESLSVHFDVVATEVELDSDARLVRLTFDRNESDDKDFVLSEIELWAQGDASNP